MIKICLKDIQNQHFARGLSKLGNWQGFLPTQAYKVGKMVEKIRKFQMEMGLLHNSIAVKFGEKDEKGNLVQPEGAAPGSFTIPDEHTEAFQKEFDAMQAMTLEIPTAPLSLEAVEKVGLTPVELVSLDGLVDLPKDDEWAEAEELADVEKPVLKEVVDEKAS